MFHWIEVTKKNEKGKIDSCNALRATTPIFIVGTNKKLNGSRVFRKGFDG